MDNRSQETRKEDMIDLLASARHACDEQEISFIECDDTAWMHYEAEKKFIKDYFNRGREDAMTNHVYDAPKISLHGFAYNQGWYEGKERLKKDD